MSMFTMQKPDANQLQQKKEIPDGKYFGTVRAAEPKRTGAGHQFIEVRLQLEGLDQNHWFPINLEHPNTKDIAQKTLSQIFTYGYKNPPTTLETAAEIAMALTGAPVSVTIKKKGISAKGYPLYGTYFNEVPSGARVEFAVRNDSLPNW